VASFGLRCPRAPPGGRRRGPSEPEWDELRGDVEDVLATLRRLEAPRRRRVREARLDVVPGRRRQVRPEKQARAEDAGADEVVPHALAENRKSETGNRAGHREAEPDSRFPIADCRPLGRTLTSAVTNPGTSLGRSSPGS